MKRTVSTWGFVLVAAAVFLTGCWPEDYRQAADEEVYGVVDQKSEDVPGMLSEFSIKQEERDYLEDLPRAEASDEMTGESTEGAGGGMSYDSMTEESENGDEDDTSSPSEQTDSSRSANAAGNSGEAAEHPQAGTAAKERTSGPADEDTQPASDRAVKVTLSKALEIAAQNSRELQTQREQVYRSALALTLERYRFQPQFFGRLSGRYNDNNPGSDTYTGNTNFGLNWLLLTGADVSVNLASNFFQFVAGDPRRAATSALDFTVVQPLLRGAGRDATEPLTQAERDIIYSLREFVRFRRTFFVRVASDYFRVLEQRQRVENQRRNLESLRKSLERQEALAEAGRLGEFQVNQTRQQVLTAEDGLESARDSYQRVLDQFKLTLALPTDAKVQLDRGEMERLREAQLQMEVPSENAAVVAALDRRLDLKTAEDRVEDARRKILVAEDDLLADLDVVLSSSTDSDGNDQPADLQFNDTDFSAGLDVDLPLDKKAERNAYRRRLIDLASNMRNLERLADSIVLDVRDSLRRFFRARSSYQIQQRSVALAERRVDMNSMLLQAGRAIPRDLLEAEADLLDARNALAESLVNYKITRLELARDMDVLQVSKQGSLEESFDVIR